MYDKMNPDIKAKWLQALRSGKFTQGRDYLKYQEEGETKHCCLGVLCEILERPQVTKSSITVFDDESMYFPSGAALRDCGISFQTSRDLAQLNDNGKSFEEIANYIEGEL